MSNLTNYQISHCNQIDYSKNIHYHLNPWPLVKNTCLLVKETHLINLVSLKKRNSSNGDSMKYVFYVALAFTHLVKTL